MEYNQEDGITYVDTTTDTPYSIGADMWEGSGNMTPEEAIEAYGSIEDAAQAVADLFDDTGAEWRDQDGDPVSVRRYVFAYLEQNA